MRSTVYHILFSPAYFSSVILADGRRAGAGVVYAGAFTGTAGGRADSTAYEQNRG